MSVFALLKLSRAEWCKNRSKLTEVFDFDRMVPAFGFFFMKDCNVVVKGFMLGILTFLRMCLRRV